MKILDGYFKTRSFYTSMIGLSFMDQFNTLKMETNKKTKKYWPLEPYLCPEKDFGQKIK